MIPKVKICGKGTFCTKEEGRMCRTTDTRAAGLESEKTQAEPQGELTEAQPF